MASFLKVFYYVWRLQALLVFVQAGFVGLVYLLFFRESITLTQLFIGEFLSSVVVSLYMLLRHVFFARLDIQLGFFLVVVAFSLLLLPFSAPLYYIYSILSGLATMTFFTPYNIVLFKARRRERSVEDMTWYWGVSIIVSVIAPLAGAYLLHGLGLTWFVGLAALLALLGIVLAQRIEKETFHYTPKEAWTHLKGLRTIMAIDGGLHRIMRIIPIFGLLYISDELDFGFFLSLMSLVALIFSLQLARRSDKTHERVRYIVPLSLAAGVVTALFGFFQSIVAFILLAVLLRALSVMVEPLRGHVMMDAEKNDPVGWISRELFLNIGRMVVMGIAVFYFAIDSVVGLFLTLGALHMLFPVVLYVKNIYGKESR